MAKSLEPAGRSPRATNISNFFDGHMSGRDPGQWPTLLRRSWELRYGQRPQPYPFGAPLGDNPQNKGSRASQYTS